MRVAVIGGGAAGLMAAIVAKRNGADVAIYEKMNRVGKKILATGNGRCNYSNRNMSIDRFHGNSKKSIENILDFFDVDSTLSFFQDLGIYPYIDNEGRIYPNSLQASSVLDVLRYEIERLNIKVITDFEIRELRYVKDKFSIINEESSFCSDRVIICCGGKSSPQLGSDGKGYDIARSFGHNIIKPFPALVQLKLKGKYFKRISGVRFDGAVTALTDGNIIREEKGEILFTDYGISGPAILQVSRMVIENINEGSTAYVSVDMFPDLTKLMLYDILNSRFSAIGYKALADSLVGFINKKLIPVILMESGLSKDEKCGRLNKKQIFKLIEILKAWQFQVLGHNTWQQSQVTAGGVDMSEINSETLESKKVHGLYFAGEILDVDGDCGGYNLQWAWSSGYTSGYFSSI